MLATHPAPPRMNQRMRNRLSGGIASLVAAILFSTNAWLTAQSAFESGGIAMIQAEQSPEVISRTIQGTTYSWQASNSIPGYSGTGFMEITPSDGPSVTALSGG